MDAITSPQLQDSLPPPPPPSSVPVAFTGNRSEFRGLVSRGAVLELLTVGFYRFWLTTNIRRHLWSHTEVDGDAPEYTGKAKELLIGFLFALAVLAPVYLGYFLIGLEAEQLQAFASIPLFVLFYLFGQFAIYRARRYRITRTVWRGVRFGMGGSGLAYMWRAALWGLFMVATLGVALPWQRAALERYKMQHTSYGDLQGHFDGTGGQLFKRGWGVWLVAMLLFVGIIAVSGAAAAMARQNPIAAALIPFVVMFIGVIAAPSLYGRFKAIEWQWWVSGVRFGEVSFESSLAKGGLTGLYWKVIGWGFLLMLILSAWIFAVVGIAAAMQDGFSNAAVLNASQQIPVVALIVIGYIAVALAYGVIVRLCLTRDMWVRVAVTTTVHNIAAAQAEASHAAMAGAIGEGFADGLDVGGF